jgi:hypothetical protein
MTHQFMADSDGESDDNVNNTTSIQAYATQRSGAWCPKLDRTTWESLNKSDQEAWDKLLADGKWKLISCHSKDKSGTAMQKVHYAGTSTGEEETSEPNESQTEDLPGNDNDEELERLIQLHDQVSQAALEAGDPQRLLSAQYTGKR